MPRKPTPSVLDQSLPPVPDEELIIPAPVEETLAAVEEILAPVVETPAAVKKKVTKIKKDVESAAEVVAEKVDAGPVEAAVESAAASLETMAEAVVEEVVPEETSEPTPHHGLVDTVVLVGIGALALALEEAPKLVNKLVARGEQTRSKVMEHRPHLHLRLRKSSKEAEAAEEPVPEAPAEEPAAAVEGETTEESEEKNNDRNVYNGSIITLNLMSFGSPVNIEPGRKKTQKS
jgi:polyhydroxyalkanoate synthesis regulator phasin